jgi:methylglutaconyl-CoA hydratase
MAKVETSCARGVFEVWIDRADVHNAFDEGVIVELTHAFERAVADPTARVLVLGGRGKSFSAGADLEWMKRAAGYDETKNQEDARALAKMLRALADSRLPTIARVHGAALGGGAGLACACDIALASKKAVFGFSEVKLGIIPAVISPHVVRKIGAARAQELFILGERFDADRAQSYGLVSRVLADDAALDAAVAETVAQLKTSGPGALHMAKNLVRMIEHADGEPPEKLDQETARWIARARSAPEGREGIAAFLEKRKPAWATEPAP